MAPSSGKYDEKVFAPLLVIDKLRCLGIILLSLLITYELTLATEIPPPLAPSVEEAYRRKCIELKRRLNDIEADNDATRLRVQRIERTIKKQRLERAFLLEQLAKRTSTNVEDSEGSPSPPPTVNATPPKTKPRLQSG